jgi:O-antigen/teichoic acid export membrane protein
MISINDNSIKSNIAWTLASNFLPFLAGLFFFPRIVHAYGLEQFGLLTLAWGLIGYFSLFDLGLSRALTQLTSNAIAHHESQTRIAELIRTSFTVMWALGLISAFTLWLLTPALINDFLKIDTQIASESIEAFTLLSLAMPFVIHSAALRGVLEALHLFKEVSITRMVLGVGTFFAPFITTYLSTKLSAAIFSLVAIRFITWLLYFLSVKHSKILNVKTKHFASDWLKPLFKFGGWMSVSNVISPLMVYMDRFLLASILGAAVTAYYVAPYEVVTKLLVIPGAFASVLFPWFAKNYAINPGQASEKLNQTMIYTLLLLFGPTLILSFFSNYWLTIWLGPEFGNQGQGTVIWLCAGVLTNGLAQILFAKVQGAGLSAWTAKLHLLEVIPYLGLLWLFMHEWGITGAAFAWFIRVFADLIGLAYFTQRINRLNTVNLVAKISLLLVCVLILLIPLIPLTPLVQWIILGVICILYCIYFFKQLRQDNVINLLLEFRKQY